jgi:tetratricopeptide (TPR) repeat protein
MNADLVKIGRLVCAQARSLAEQDALKSATEWLRDHEGWLLIIDNAENPRLLLNLLSNTRNGHVLVTTRARSLGGLAHAVQIEALNAPEAALMLLRRSRMLPLTATLQDATEEDVLLASQLVHELGGLPLAIDQAAAFLEETSSDIEEYLDAFRRHRYQLLNRRGDFPIDHPAAAAATLSVSLEQLFSTDPIATDLLRLCAYLDPDEIPEEILTEGASAVCPSLRVMSAGPIRLHQAIASLRRFSLITRNPSRRALSIHRLVQACLHEGMNRADRPLWQERAARSVQSVLPDSSTSYSSLGQPSRAVQVLHASMYLGEAESRAGHRASALWHLAAQQQVLGRLAASERSLRDCLALCSTDGPRADKIKAHQYLGLLRAYQGLAKESAEQLASAESLLSASIMPALGSSVMAYRALCALLAGNLDVAAETADRAHDLARHGDVRDEIRATWMHGRVLTMLADRSGSREGMEASAQALGRALGMCRSGTVVDYEADLLLALAHLSLVKGDAAGAALRGREALSIASRAGFRVLEADINNLLAQVALLTGKRREARAHAQRALTCAECDGPPYCYAPAVEVARRHLNAASLSAH